MLRLQILNTIISDLSRLSVANGYFHDAPPASKYYSAQNDPGILPHINVYCGDEQNSPVEAGIESSLKIKILTHIHADTDIKKEGLLTEEIEHWIFDYWKFFTHPSCEGSDVLKISTLWNIDGITYYYISSVEPYYDKNDNSKTLMVELTVDYVIIS